MKSNGYGRFKQNIVVHVEKQHADDVATILGVRPFKETENPPRVFFEWTRLTKRPGNDEDVVWDLSMLLGSTRDWQIDWENSVY